jgi:hypothetical protein
LEEIVDTLDVWGELSEREVEVNGPCGVDDLGYRVLHAFDGIFVEAQVGFVDCAD